MQFIQTEGEQLPLVRLTVPGQQYTTPHKILGMCANSGYQATFLPPKWLI